MWKKHDFLGNCRVSICNSKSTQNCSWGVEITVVNAQLRYRMRNSTCNIHVLQDSCAADVEPAVMEGSKQFGLSRNSHIAAAFDDTKVKNR